MTLKPAIDVCCGLRMTWFNKQDPRAVFCDRRSETLTVTDRTHREDGTRTLVIEPDFLMDFRSMPFPDESFWHVAFDPPHLERAGPRSWLAAKYGKLGQIGAKTCVLGSPNASESFDHTEPWFSSGTKPK